MNKKKRAPKKSELTATLQFRNKVDGLKYKPVPLEDVTTDIVEKKRVKPKRASIENVLQNQYRYKSKTGFASKILTATKDGVLNATGTAWVHVVNEKDELVWTREFYKKDLKGVLKRTAIYGQVAKNIADSRPKGAKLVALSETEYAWVSRNGKKHIAFDLNDYLYGLSDKDKLFVQKHEYARDYYLLNSEDKVVNRQRDIQKKWK